MEDVMKNVKPTIVGRIRKEAFGGIYYERDRLVIFSCPFPQAHAQPG